MTYVNIAKLRRRVGSQYSDAERGHMHDVTIYTLC